jgi:hypothetical protein
MVGSMPRRPRPPRKPRPLLYDAGLERRRAACATKERYASEAEARSIALKNAPRGRSAGTKPYQCDVCGGWHLTSA